MLDVDGLKERFNVNNTHTLGIPGSVSWLNMYNVLLVHARTIGGGGLFAGIREILRPCFEKLSNCK